MSGRDLVVTRWGARFLGRRLPCAIGRGGMTTAKREGDGATPLGIYPVSGFRMFSRKGIGQPIRRDLIWSDDPRDVHYNDLGFADPVIGYDFSHERLWRADRLYDVVIDIGYNRAQIAGKGSAIFIHHWRKPRHPTAGCIAFAPRDLRWLLSSLTALDRLVIR